MRLGVNMAENGLLPDVYGLADAGRWLVPFEITFWQAAAAPESLSLLLVGTVIMLPIILAYVGYCYYVFRGKTSHEATY